MKPVHLGRRRFLRVAAATLAFAGSWRIAQARALHPPLVMIDPGHGGIDPGCIGASGVYEKDITISLARRLAETLDATGRYRVSMTRDDDEFVALERRVALARAAHADLFLSIHADALPDPQMRGASVFTLSEQASDRVAAALAARENSADLVAGIDLARHAPEVGSVLIDLERRATDNQSIRFAGDLVDELGQRVAMLENSHRSAGFAVLKAPDIPSALVETGCLSNVDEEAELCRPAYQRKLVMALSRSIGEFFASRAAS